MKAKPVSNTYFKADNYEEYHFVFDKDNIDHTLIGGKLYDVCIFIKNILKKRYAAEKPWWFTVFDIVNPLRVLSAPYAILLEETVRSKQIVYFVLMDNLTDGRYLRSLSLYFADTAFPTSKFYSKLFKEVITDHLLDTDLVL